MKKVNDQYLKENRSNMNASIQKLNGNKPIMQMTITERDISQRAITQKKRLNVNRKRKFDSIICPFP